MNRIKVTDHAVVRYLEREFGIDIESVRKDIGRTVESAGGRKLLDFTRGTPCRIKAGGGVFCVRGDTVTTYWPRNEPVYRGRRGTGPPGSKT